MRTSPIERNMYGMPVPPFRNFRETGSSSFEGGRLLSGGNDETDGRGREVPLHEAGGMDRILLLLAEDRSVAKHLTRQFQRTGFRVITVSDEHAFWREVFHPALSLIVVESSTVESRDDLFRRSLADFGFTNRLPVLFFSVAEGERDGLEDPTCYLTMPVEFRNLSAGIRHFAEGGAPA